MEWMVGRDCLRNKPIGSICRLCLEEEILLKNILSCDGAFTSPKETTLREKVLECTSIEINERDGLPSNICLKCLEEVEKIHKFKLKCVSSDALLRKHIKRQRETFEKVENEAAIADSSSDCDFGSSESDTVREEDSAMADSTGMRPASPESTPSQDLPEIKFDPSMLEVVIKEENNSRNCFRSVGNQIGSMRNSRRKAKVHGNNIPVQQDSRGTSRIRTRKLSRNSKVKGASTPFPDQRRKTSHKKMKFVCLECNKTFKHKYSLTRHLSTHSGEFFNCNECHKSFQSREGLHRHERSHFGIKPYQCQHCEKSYISSTSFACHVRKHTGERPYKCSECDETFYLMSSFDRHMAKHKGTKSYVCEICSASFWVADDLRAHVNRVH